MILGACPRGPGAGGRVCNRTEDPPGQNVRIHGDLSGIHPARGRAVTETQISVLLKMICYAKLLA